MAEEQWYYSTQGRQQGPVPREMLRQLIISAEVRQTDMVWTPGMAQWAAAQTVPHLLDALTPMQQGMAAKEPVIEMAGFWRRFAACAIDTIVVAALSSFAALGALLAVAGYGASLDVVQRLNRPTFLTEIALAVAVLLVNWLYYALMESSSHQATLGKLIIGICVTTESGDRLTFIQATARFIAKIVSALLLLIGFLMAGWTARKQALHDIAAGTLVVRCN